MAVTLIFYYSFAIARVAGTVVTTLATARSTATATAILSGYSNRIIEKPIVRSRGCKKLRFHRLLTERKVGDTVAAS
ncbi:hypothetical protein, partial [Yersinia enterocolitica]|uniref:hypothetical protein n=1 Tax=Yersinia enterocolitica TaxID=630 RepID=UPI0020C2041B